METNRTKFHFLRVKPLSLTAIGLLLAGIAGVAFNHFDSADGLSEDTATFVVKRGPLRISVTESGTIQALEQIIIKSEVEGRTTILSLVEEGTSVKKGDLLVELDASQLVDTRIDQEISVQNAEAAFIRAREDLAVIENQAKSNTEEAQLALRFAKLDLRKYLEGEYQNQHKEAESLITLAKEELQIAEEKLTWTKRLFEKEYVSQSELDVDKLSVNKRRLSVELAESDLGLLENFTYPRQLAALESDVNQTDMALERTMRRATADVVQAKADLRAKESEYNRQRDKLAKLETQIEKTTIYAPADGLVIYATSAQTGHWHGNEEPLDEGREVREREELIYLPTALAVKAEVKVHEASLQKVSVGLPVKVTVDALPDRTFTGRVAKIAPLPDAASVWMNPDLKVYNTDIHIDGEDSDLRTGMSCRAEIVIEEYDDVVYAPVQAVLRVGGKPTAYVLNGITFEPEAVTVGLDNNRMVRIVSGLNGGEVVLLTPPLASAELAQAEDMSAAGPGGGVDGRRQLPGPALINARGQPPAQEQDQQQRPSRDTNPSPEQMQEMRGRFENMSPEDREEALREVRNARRRREQGQ